MIEGAVTESVVATEANQSRSNSNEDADLAMAISKLSREHREVVQLFYGEDLAIDDVASVLGVPAGTVKSRLHHARESLKNYLGE